jgi:hypothetical protein
MKKFYLLIFSLVSFLFISGQTIDKENFLARDWTIVATYSIPGKASGLAFDGTYIYSGIYGSNGDKVYRFDPVTGNSQLQFSSSAIEDSYGLTWDGQYLWATDHVTSSSVPATAYQLDLSGNLISQFDLPDHYMSGIAYDNGNFWVCTYYPDPSTIYKVDVSGAILESFQSPGNQPWDICLENDNLWIADYNDNVLYKTDQSGNILESHPSENIKPAGIVFDGQYLWYVDGALNSNSTLYKIDLGGSGTPVIYLPETSHDFGTVAVGDSSIWDMTIYNNGNADLTVYYVNVPSAPPIFYDYPLPVTISQGDFIQIPLIYAPPEIGTLNTIITVESDDPVNPWIEVTLTGEAVISGPNINIPVSTHNFGNIRLNALTGWIFEIENIGDEILIIEDILPDDPAFIIDNSVVFPYEIGVLGSAEFRIWFNPVQIISYNSLVNVYNNDLNNNPYEMTVSGTGVEMEFPIGENLWNYTITTSYDNSPKGIVPIQDINGDGIVDVIVASEDGFVRAFNGNAFNTGDILWENESGSLYNQNSLNSCNDLNADGYEDVIIGTAWGGRSIIAISGFTGETLWIHDTHEYGGGGWLYQVDSKYDYNNDGINDVLAATGNDGSNTGPRRVYCLNGLNGNSIWERLLDGAVFSVIGIEDFTNDGIPDVAAGATNSSETEGKVAFINGASGFVEGTFITQGSSVWAIESLGDINGDGINDVAAGDFSGNFYFLDPVNASQIHSGSLGSVLILRFEKLDDVNGDGYSDILIAHSGTNGVVINGYNASNIWLHPLADKSWNVDKIADINGDGINDVIIGTLYSNNYGYFLDGTDGTELCSIPFGSAIDAISAIPDITGDGSMEIILGGRSGEVYCFSGGLDASGLETQDIDLNLGYQFVSTYLISEEADMEIILTDILTDNLDFVRNSEGETFRKIGPIWVNGIGDWIFSEGYLFKMFGEEVLSITGEKVNISTPIQLETGFQFISYFLDYSINALDAFEVILNDNLDFIRNSDGSTVRKIGPNWVNGIGDCHPGDGFLVKMFADDELIYPATAVKSIISKDKIATTHFYFNGGNAADPVFTIYVSGLEIGDEVAAYDGNVIVGAVKITSENYLENELAVFSTLTEGEGYISGNDIRFIVWDNDQQTELICEYEFLNPYGTSYLKRTYPEGDGKYSIVKFSKSGPGIDEINNETLTIYPNPASDYFIVQSELKINRIQLFNYSGIIVYESIPKSESLRINTENLTQGLYFVRVETENKTVTKQIIIE